MRFRVSTLFGLAMLTVGIGIGIVIAPSVESKVLAQQNPTGCVDSQTVECVTPIMTVGSAGIGKLVTNQIATDQLSVNGYDILKLQNNILGALVQRGIITGPQAQSIAEQSHPDRVLKYQPPRPPATITPGKP